MVGDWAPTEPWLSARHPKFTNRVIIVMAGAHSLGTGAACLVATRTRDVAEISNRLKAGELENNNDVLWALVEGTIRDTATPDQFESRVIDAGTYTPFANHAYARR